MNGQCTACYKGYDLNSGSCVLSPSNTARSSDVGCMKWDWDNNRCLECSSHWVFNNDKICTPVNSDCKTHS